MSEEGATDAGERRAVLVECERGSYLRGWRALGDRVVGAHLENDASDHGGETDAGDDPARNLEACERVDLGLLVRREPQTLRVAVHGATPLAHRKGDERGVVVTCRGVGVPDDAERHAHDRCGRARDPERAWKRATGRGGDRWDDDGRRNHVRDDHVGTRHRNGCHRGRDRRIAHDVGRRRMHPALERLASETERGQCGLDGGAVEADHVPPALDGLGVVGDHAVEERESLFAVALTLERFARAGTTFEPVGQRAQGDGPVPRGHGGREVALALEATSFRSHAGRLGPVGALGERDLGYLGERGRAHEEQRRTRRKGHETGTALNVHWFSLLSVKRVEYIYPTSRLDRTRYFYTYFEFCRVPLYRRVNDDTGHQKHAQYRRVTKPSP